MLYPNRNHLSEYLSKDHSSALVLATHLTGLPFYLSQWLAYVLVNLCHPSTWCICLRWLAFLDISEIYLLDWRRVCTYSVKDNNTFPSCSVYYLPPLIIVLVAGDNFIYVLTCWLMSWVSSFYVRKPYPKNPLRPLGSLSYSGSSAMLICCCMSLIIFSWQIMLLLCWWSPNLSISLVSWISFIEPPILHNLKYYQSWSHVNHLSGNYLG
jgi:hypothetical protein